MATLTMKKLLGGHFPSGAPCSRGLEITSVSTHSEKEEANNEIPKESYISPVKRQQIIDELKLV